MRWDDVVHDAGPNPWLPPEEGLSPDILDTFNALWPKIVQDCNRTLQAMKEANIMCRSMFLYRGCRTFNNPIERKVTKENRSPLTTRKDVHYFVESWLKEKGFDARRSNSIFVTSNYSQARKYASAYRKHHSPAVVIVIPSDSAAFTWSPVVNDLYYYFYSRSINNLQNWNEHLERAQYRDYDMRAAICSKNEVMVCGTYWALDLRLRATIRERLGKI